MMRYFVFKDGEIIGQSLSEGGAYSMLLSTICRTTGTYAIMTMTDEDYQARGCEFDYRDAGNLNLTWDHGGHLLEVEQPLWTPEHIEEWHALQPGTDKFKAKPTRFAIDDLFEVEGFSTGQTWNGWAVPYFTKSQVEKVKEALTKSGLTPWVRWETEEDGTIVVQNASSYEDEPDDIWSPETIDGVDEPVWCIGGFAWVWEVTA